MMRSQIHLLYVWRSPTGRKKQKKPLEMVKPASVISLDRTGGEWGSHCLKMEKKQSFPPTTPSWGILLFGRVSNTPKGEGQTSLSSTKRHCENRSLAKLLEMKATCLLTLLVACMCSEAALKGY